MSRYKDIWAIVCSNINPLHLPNNYHPTHDHKNTFTRHITHFVNRFGTKLNLYFYSHPLRTTGILDDSEYKFILYYDNCLIHRLNGPAVIHENGDKEWFFYGKRHRNNGPAIKSANNEFDYYYSYGQLHRIDGPAIEDDMTIKYYFQGQEYELDEYNKLMYYYHLFQRVLYEIKFQVI